MTRLVEGLFAIWLLGALAYCTMHEEGDRRFAPIWPYALYHELEEERR